MNGVLTHILSDGRIEDSVPYTLKSRKITNSVTVWFVKDDGSIEPITTVYKDGHVTFTTDHLSQYLIVSFPFTDVAESAWYYGNVAYTYTNAYSPAPPAPPSARRRP